MHINQVKVSRTYKAADGGSITYELKAVMGQSLKNDPVETLAGMEMALRWLNPEYRETVQMMGDPDHVLRELLRMHSMTEDQFEEYYGERSRSEAIEANRKLLHRINTARRDYNQRLARAMILIEEPEADYEWREPGSIWSDFGTVEIPEAFRYLPKSEPVPISPV